MLAQTSLQLLRELKRSEQTMIPPYDEEKIRMCIDEMNDLYQANHSDVQLVSASEGSQDTDVSSRINSVLVRHAIVERNKRSLLAYHYNRLTKIKELRWQVGTVPSKEVRQNLSESEQAWFKSYSQLLTVYMQAEAGGRGGAGGLDLTQTAHPPKALLLEVRCLTDYGDFETEDGGIVHLARGTQHAMLRSDCEPLIRQGVLEHIIA